MCIDNGTEAAALGIGKGILLDHVGGSEAAMGKRADDHREADRFN